MAAAEAMYLRAFRLAAGPYLTPCMSRPTGSRQLDGLPMSAAAETVWYCTDQGVEQKGAVEEDKQYARRFGQGDFLRCCCSGHLILSSSVTPTYPS